MRTVATRADPEPVGVNYFKTSGVINEPSLWIPETYSRPENAPFANKCKTWHSGMVGVIPRVMLVNALYTEYGTVMMVDIFFAKGSLFPCMRKTIQSCGSSRRVVSREKRTHAWIQWGISCLFDAAHELIRGRDINNKVKL